MSYLYVFQSGKHYSADKKISVKKLLSLGFDSKFYLFKITDQKAIPEQQFEEVQIKKSGVISFSELTAADSWSPKHHIYGKKTDINIICPGCQKTAQQKVKNWIKPERTIYHCSYCGKSYKETA